MCLCAFVNVRVFVSDALREVRLSVLLLVVVCMCCRRAGDI